MLHLYVKILLSYQVVHPPPQRRYTPSWSLSPLSLGHPILYPEKHSTLLSTLWLRTARLIFLKQHSLVAQLVKNLPAMQVDPFLTQRSNPESPTESYVSLPSIKNPHVTFHIKSKFLGLTPKTRPSQSPTTLLLQVCKYGVGKTDRQTDRHTHTHKYGVGKTDRRAHTHTHTHTFHTHTQVWGKTDRQTDTHTHTHKYGVGKTDRHTHPLHTHTHTHTHTHPFPPRVMLVLNPESLSLSLSHTHTPTPPLAKDEEPIPQFLLKEEPQFHL